MAHADKHCCGICDNTICYSENAEAKEMLCSNCANKLGLLGVRASDPGDLINYFNELPLTEVLKILKKLEYKKCFYSNKFDDRIEDFLSKKDNLESAQSIDDQQKAIDPTRIAKGQDSLK